MSDFRFSEMQATAYAVAGARTAGKAGENLITRSVLYYTANGTKNDKTFRASLIAAAPELENTVKRYATLARRMYDRHTDVIREAYRTVNDRTLDNVRAVIADTLFGAGGLYAGVAAAFAAFAKPPAEAKSEDEKAKAALERLCAAITGGEYSATSLTAIQAALDTRASNARAEAEAAEARAKAREAAEKQRAAERSAGVKHLVSTGMPGPIAEATYDMLRANADDSGQPLVLPGMPETPAEDRGEAGAAGPQGRLD